MLLALSLLCGCRLPAEPRVLGLFALPGLFDNAVSFPLIVRARTRITGSLAAILNATTPFWSVLLARFLARDERAGPRRLFGVATGFAGVVPVVGGDVGGGEPLAALAGLALACTALACLLCFRILATAGATNLLLVTLLIPPAAILLGVLLLDEHLAASHLAGMVTIATGLAILDGRLPSLAVRRLAAFRGVLR